MTCAPGQCPRCRLPPNGRERAGGFSLVELLVVIAIIAVLVAIMVPSLGRAAELARAAACRSNLHQVGTAIRTYIAGWDQYYPAGHTWNKSHYYPKCVITWVPNLRIYTRQEELFCCPSGAPEAEWVPVYDTADPEEYGYAQGERRLYSYTPFSYGYNNWGTSDFRDPQLGLGSMAEYTNPGDPDWGPIRAHRVQVASEMFAIADSRVDGVWDAFIDSNQPPEYPYDRHLDRCSVAFCDGHAEAMYTIDMIDTTDAAQRRWNNDNKPH